MENLTPDKHLGPRTHTRFRVECVARTKLSNSMVGIITEINREGLVFRYVQDNAEDKKCMTGYLKVSIHLKEGFCLQNVPCRIIKDNELLPEYCLGSTKMQKCYLRFGPLTNDQKSQLDYFISHYTKGSA